MERGWVWPAGLVRAELLCFAHTASASHLSMQIRPRPRGTGSPRTTRHCSASQPVRVGGKSLAHKSLKIPVSAFPPLFFFFHLFSQLLTLFSPLCIYSFCCSISLLSCLICSLQSNALLSLPFQLDSWCCKITAWVCEGLAYQKCDLPGIAPVH